MSRGPDRSVSSSRLSRLWETFGVSVHAFRRVHRVWYAAIGLAIYATAASWHFGYPMPASWFALLAVTLATAAYLGTGRRRDG